MSTIVAHAHGALSAHTPSPAEREARSRDRIERLAALDPEQFPLALSFLAGYCPAMLDAALDAIEPDTVGQAPEMEPYCTWCGLPVAVFAAHGDAYMHYKGVLSTASKPRPCKADHKAVIGWRPATDIPVRAV